MGNGWEMGAVARMFYKLGFVRLFGTRPDEGIGPYKMHTVGPRALTGPPLPRFNYPHKPQFIAMCVGAHHDAPFSGMYPRAGAS